MTSTQHVVAVERRIGYSVVTMVVSIPLLLIIFFGIFTQSLTGFGFALVAMPFMIQLLGTAMAGPLGALIAITSQVLLTYRYRHLVKWRAIAPMCIAAVVGIPLGVKAVQIIAGSVLLDMLGVILVGYATYSLFDLHLPRLRHPAWGVAAGFASGLLSGAYNVGGPPLVMYAGFQKWSPQEFKGNLQGVFLVNSLSVIFVHLLAGHYHADVIEHYIMVLPALVVGILMGLSSDRWLNPALFRRVVLLLLIGVGINLILS